MPKQPLSRLVQHDQADIAHKLAPVLRQAAAPTHGGAPGDGVQLFGCRTHKLRTAECGSQATALAAVYVARQLGNGNAQGRQAGVPVGDAFLEEGDGGWLPVFACDSGQAQTAASDAPTPPFACTRARVGAM